MKKFILFIFTTILLVGCSKKNEDRTYGVSYEIVYPDTTIKYTEVFDIAMYSDCDKYPDKVRVHSARGTNYLSHVNQIGCMVSSNCPIRIISYKRLK